MVFSLSFGQLWLWFLYRFRFPFRSLTLAGVVACTISGRTCNRSNNKNLQMISLLNLQSGTYTAYRLLQSWLWHPGWPLATSNGALVLQLSDGEIAHALRPSELYLCIKLGKWVDWDRNRCALALLITMIMAAGTRVRNHQSK